MRRNDFHFLSRTNTGFQFRAYGMLSLFQIWCKSVKIYTVSGTKLDWIGLCSVLCPRQHSIGYMADGFYRSKDPTNSIEVLKERSGTKHEIREYRKLVAADLSVVTVHALLTIAGDQIYAGPTTSCFCILSLGRQRSVEWFEVSNFVSLTDLLTMVEEHLPSHGLAPPYLSDDCQRNV